VPDIVAPLGRFSGGGLGGQGFMGEHEIESLVEHSVIAVDRALVEQARARDVILGLFRVQEHFDCGYTHCRVGEILLRRRALLPEPLARHPDAERYRGLFERLHDQEGWLSSKTDAAGTTGLHAWLDMHQRLWATDAGPPTEPPRGLVDADHEKSVFFTRGMLQLDVGTPLWRRLVQRGEFSGLDAQEPERFPLQALVAMVLEAAATTNDRELLGWWYGAFPAVVWRLGEPEDPSSLCSDPHVQSMLELVERTRAFELRSDWQQLRPYRPEDLQEASPEFQRFAAQWLALSWSLPPQRDRSSVVSDIAAELAAALEAGSPPGEALARAVADLGEFRDWSSFIVLFMRGFGYPIGMRLAPLIKQVVDFRGPEPRVDVAKANALLSLQQR
jgi:hypothetical protein